MTAPPKRFLLFSDLHADFDQAQKIVDRSHDFDIVIGAGDFGNLRRQLTKTIEVIRAIRCPVVLVAGNNESTEELQNACHSWKSAHVLHGSGVTIEGIPFWGIGGGVPTTPFGDWSYDFTEAEAAALLADCPRKAVLVSHSPPQGVLDRSSSGKHLGSTSVLAAMQRTTPQLVVCGHIHASCGQSLHVGKTCVINAGPLGVEWTLG